jgi:hypothetical protein
MTFLTNNSVRWCWANDIYISPVAVDNYGTRLRIDIIQNGISKPGKEVFSSKPSKSEPKIWHRIEELYQIIYERDHKQSPEGN